MKAKEVCVFGLFGAMMYASKVAMSMLPNIHLLAFFIMLFTVTYGKKALYIIYCYIFIEGLFSGFALWWIPYLYIWTILWFVSYKLLSKDSPTALFSFIGFCFGILFGTFYAPSQAILYGLNIEQMLVWTITGLPFDVIHGISNLVMCSFVPPVLKIMEKANIK